MHSAGFVINDAKSVWIPSHQVMWLGFAIDLLEGRVFVPQGKLDALVSLLKASLTFNSLGVKRIASMWGRLFQWVLL